MAKMMKHYRLLIEFVVQFRKIMICTDNISRLGIIHIKVYWFVEKYS